MKKLYSILILSSIVLGYQACSDDDEPSVNDLKKQAIENYADIVFATYDDSYKTAEILKAKIDAFINAPTATGFEECKTAWKAARVPYGQTEAFRFYGGPIDDADGPEGLINAWPIDENFIDYVEGNTNAGLINDPSTYPTISKQVLKDLNESISETSIFTGYHAIEFLLWGQDLNDAGPGSRPYTDYVSGDGATAENQQRRGQYLKVVTELLLENITSVKEEWKEGGTYRGSFVGNVDVAKTIGEIFTGMGELSKGELAGERMLVAVETQDQENEHSCFSDNTIVDIKMNFQSVKNVYTGTYTRADGTTVSGTSFKQIAERLDKTKADAVAESFTEAETKINLIPAPFDQAIKNSQNIIISATQSLSTLSDRLSDVALVLGAAL